MKPRYRLMRSSGGGWYHFVNVNSPAGLGREHYAIRSSDFWGEGCPACGGYGDKHDLGVHLNRGETPVVKYAEAGDIPT